MAAAVAPAEDTLSSDLSPQLRVRLQEIDRVFASLDTMTHYQVLGLEATAGTELVKGAYLAAAKRWHSDSYAGVALGARARRLETIFARVGEASTVLSDPAQRKGYDFLLERERQGLPTDVAVIIEAEGLFHRAQNLVRRGQGVAAAALLRRAVELNKGEAEFWAYLGYATYLEHGQAQLSQALDALRKAGDMNDKLDVVSEFQGRIAHAEGRPDDAVRHLKRALALNPKNREAERELRLISMRKDKQASSSGGLLRRFFKR